MDGLLDAQMQAALLQSRPDGAAGARSAGGDPARAHAAAEELEAVFLAQLLQAMIPEPDKESGFTGGPGESAFRGMLHEEYAKVMAKAGGVGLADDLTREILRYQEASESPE